MSDTFEKPTPQVAPKVELTVDEIIAAQIAEAKAAGKEYQGRV